MTLPKFTIPAEFAGKKGLKICLSFTELLLQSNEKEALAMLEEHPWMALRDAPSHKNFPESFKNCPYLHIAVHMASLPLLHSLLDKGAPIDKFDSSHRSAIFDAVNDAMGADPESEKMAWALIRRGARCDGLSKEGSSLVYMKQGQTSPELFYSLVEKGAPLSLRFAGESLLTRMLRSAYEFNGDDPANTSNPIHSALLTARAETRLRNCRLRITAGADVDMHLGEVESHALHVALANNDLNMADLLVEHGANPRWVDDHRNTFLHSKNNGVGAVRWLINQGVDLEARNAWGETPLIFATRHIGRANGPNYETVIALMAAGANLDVFDHQGEGVGKSPREWLVHEEEAANGATAYLDLLTTCRAMEARRSTHQMLEEIEQSTPKIRPGA